MLNFADLVEGVTYYAKYKTISHVDNKILVENNFSKNYEDNRSCHDHRIPVIKKHNLLTTEASNIKSEIPYKMYRLWGNIKPPSTIQLHINGDVKFGYKADNVPSGIRRYVVPWSIKRTTNGLVINSNAACFDSMRYPAWLEVVKQGNHFYVEKCIYDHLKKEHRFDVVSDCSYEVREIPIRVISNKDRLFTTLLCLLKLNIHVDGLMGLLIEEQLKLEPSANLL